MPTRALTPCTTPGCPELISGGRCPDCRSTAERARGSGTARGYTSRWAAFSKGYLRRHPRCECGQDCCPDGCEQSATDVDHKDGTGRTGPRAYDPTNLVALCHGCHSRKTVHQDGGFGRS